MANFISNATDNFTGASTFATVEAAATQATFTANTTTTTSFVYTATFTATNALVYDGFLLFLTNNGNAAGTFTVSLFDGTTDHTMTVNVNDLPTATTGAWCFFKLGSTVTGNGAAGWKIGVKSSTAGQVTVYRNATAGNWATLLRTTTAGSPGAADNMYVVSELTGAGTSNLLTVTMNQTATTSYGNIDVCFKGNLVYGVAASTAYYLRVGIGTINVWDSGTFSKGTSIATIPSTSSQVLEFNCTVNVDSGLVINNNGIFNDYGTSRGTTAWTKMTVDKAAAATVITLADTSGMLASDQVVFTDTDSRGSGHWEIKTILTVDSGTQITLTAGLTNAHSGTSPTQCEVGSVTRNSKIRGVSSSLCGYLTVAPTAVVNMKYVELLSMGSNTTGKRGIDVQTTTGTFFPQYCGIHDFAAAGSIGFNLTGVTTNVANINIDSNVLWNLTGTGNCYITGALTAVKWTINNNLIVGASATSGCVTLTGDSTAIYTGNALCGGANGNAATFGGQMGSFSGNTFHNTPTTGFTLNGFYNSTFSSGAAPNVSYRNGTSGVNLTMVVDVTLGPLTCFGNGTQSIAQGNQTFSDNVVLQGFVSNGDTTFSTATGISCGGNQVSMANLQLENASMSQVSGIKTAHTQDFNLSNTAPSFFTAVSRNGLHGSTLVANMSTMQLGSYVNFQSFNQTAGNHKSIQVYGITSIDTTIYDVSPSERLTPNNASNKFVSAPIYKAVDSGNTVTATVKVRQSSNPDGDSNSYTGNLPNLKVLKNVAAGIAADTILATATSAYNSAGGNHGQFQTLSGTTIAVTDDAVLTFVVDCDGIAGWINVDTASAA